MVELVTVRDRSIVSRRSPIRVWVLKLMTSAFPIPGAPPLRPLRVSAMRVMASLNRDMSSTSRVLKSGATRSEEHTSELQSRENLVCRLLLEKKKKAKDHGGF